MLSGKGETFMSEKEYSVSEAVRLVGVESHVLRYWEEELQVEIRRTSQGHRIYSESNIETFRRVRELKERGLQLKAIRVLLDEAEGDTAKASLTEQISGIGNHQGKMESDIEQRYTEDTAEKGESQESPESYEVCQPYQTVLSEIEGQNPDNLKQFEEILKSLIREVIEDQTKKQEQQLREILREEIRQMHFSYEELLQDAMREAAVSQEVQEKKGIIGALRKMLRHEKI